MPSFVCVFVCAHALHYKYMGYLKLLFIDQDLWTFFVPVTCLQCKAESNTYDPFLDLSLDVKNVPSILIALQKFVQPETLDIDNAYNCTK